MRVHDKFLPVLAAVAALLLGACSDHDPTGVETARPETRTKPALPQFATAPVGPQWYIFNSQTPTEYIDAVPGWEVSTRFKSSKSGKIKQLWFWRAPNETGTNTGHLWSDTGQELASANFPAGYTGWVAVNIPPVQISANTYYRVSVNTNTQQAKWPGGFSTGGTVNSGPLTASGSHYGQPMGSMPTSSSASIFFVDVTFEEDVPLPNLYVALINPTLKNINGQEIIIVRVCNQGPGSTTRTTAARLEAYWQYAYQYSWQYNVPPLGPGQCHDYTPVYSSPLGFNEYKVWVDLYDVEYESNENNYAYSSWNRTF